MAWHLHNFQRRLILASLIRRHVNTSVEFCSLVKNGYRIPYQCNCLQHKYQAGAASVFHLSNSSHLHTANEPKSSVSLPQPRGKIIAQWLWEHQQISPGHKSRNGGCCHESSEPKTKHSSDPGALSEDNHSDEFQQHSRRSQSVYRDRRETRLMCINNNHGTFVYRDNATTSDFQSPTVEIENECSEERKDTDPPVVFVLDSKGKQVVLNLLAEHKQSSDHSAVDKLNHLIDVIQRDSHCKLQDSKDITNWKVTRHKLDGFETCFSRKSSTYEEYLQAVNNRHLSFYGHSQSVDAVSRRAARQNRLSLQCSSVNLSHGGKNSAPGPSSNKGRGAPSKEQLAVMYQRLHDQIPNFYSQSHDYTMYSSDVVFDNRILNVKTTGLPAYKATLQSLKYLSTACLYNVNLEVLNLTINTEMNCIQARWRVTGVPLHRLILLPWKKDAKKYFDAFSTFDVGSDGLVHTHILDKVMPNPGDKLAVPSLLTRIGMALGVVRPSSPAVQGNCTGNVNLAFMKPKWFFTKQQNI